MTDPMRVAVTVTLLAHDDVARRLVISWPLLRRKLTGAAQHRRWAELAGVGVHEVERRAVALTAHGICRADGTVDPEAERVVQHVAAEALRRMSGT